MLEKYKNPKLQFEERKEESEGDVISCINEVGFMKGWCSMKNDYNLIMVHYL